MAFINHLCLVCCYSFSSSKYNPRCQHMSWRQFSDRDAEVDLEYHGHLLLDRGQTETKRGHATELVGTFDTAKCTVITKPVPSSEAVCNMYRQLNRCNPRSGDEPWMSTMAEIRGKSRQVRPVMATMWVLHTNHTRTAGEEHPVRCVACHELRELNANSTKNCRMNLRSLR